MPVLAVFDFVHSFWIFDFFQRQFFLKFVRRCFGRLDGSIYTLEYLGPLGTIWDHLGPSGDHLGNGFDEVIDFITESDLPECADRSV